MAGVGTTGEVCIVDAITNAVVANSTLTFNNTAWGCVNGAVFQLQAGKAYTIGLRKSTGIFSSVQMRAATITLKLLSV